jgi:signal transduction histidine kinase
MMMRKAFRDAVRHPTSLVFLFVVFAGLVMGYAKADPPLTSSELIWIALLSLVYIFTGTVIFIAVLTSGSPRYKILYLAFQIVVGMLILHLERGNGWLVLLPLASHSVALFSPREAFLPCALITLGIAWETSQQLPTWIPFLQSALVFGSAVFFAAVFTNISIHDARRREEIERLAAKLEEANRELHVYAAQVEELSAAQERNRLAREIHDSLGHYLTAMNLQAQVVSTLITQDAGRAQEALARMQVMILEALADVRRSVATIRSEPFLGKNLLEALEPLLEESRNAGLVTELIVNGEVRPLPAAFELTLYRAVQEGLTNARKHAQARRVIVLLEYRPGEVNLHIQDDGAGSTLDTEQLNGLKSNFGLFGLRERVQLLGGKLGIQTAPERGFCLEINLPERNGLQPRKDSL